MLHEQYRFDESHTYITIFSNGEYSIRLRCRPRNLHQPLSYVVTHDICRRIANKNTPSEHIRVLIDILSKINNDNDPTLWTYLDVDETRCMDCKVDGQRTPLIVSEFAPGHCYELVCNDCEKNRGIEYFGTEEYPPF